MANNQKGRMPNGAQEVGDPNSTDEAVNKIDAIELQNSHLFRDGLDTWDCDCIVVMNPGVIIPV